MLNTTCLTYGGVYAANLLKDLDQLWRERKGCDTSGTTVTAVLYDRESRELTSINIGDTHACVSRGDVGAVYLLRHLSSPELAPVFEFGARLPFIRVVH
jgi:serine phosphatase RsbU (regulator of sigma subunit)